ncbi:hypothetical protein PR048_014490 [Dryococelus australis]|uniref:Uncharacterized protein n=1 Tax=Dryococelus australis TaxID=614101 RepID=A0ABQ9HED8_9NEOP|nr:hypothetical protein PR048_014490 [Dryococelus australis]
MERRQNARAEETEVPEKAREANCNARPFFLTCEDSGVPAGNRTRFALAGCLYAVPAGNVQLLLLTTRLTPRRNGFDSRLGRSSIFAGGNRAGRCRWWWGLSGSQDLDLTPPVMLRALAVTDQVVEVSCLMATRPSTRTRQEICSVIRFLCGPNTCPPGRQEVLSAITSLPSECGGVYTLLITYMAGATVAQWLRRSPPTTAIHDPGSIPGGFTPGFSHVGIVLDDAACRRVFSGYSRLSPAPPSLYSSATPSQGLTPCHIGAKRHIGERVGSFDVERDHPLIGLARIWACTSSLNGHCMLRKGSLLAEQLTIRLPGADWWAACQTFLAASHALLPELAAALGPGVRDLVTDEPPSQPATRVSSRPDRTKATAPLAGPRPATSLPGCRQYRFCDRVFTYGQNARRDEIMACKKSLPRAMKHYDNGYMRFVQGDAMKEDSQTCKGSSTGSRQVMSSIPPATSMGTVFADDYDESVNAKDAMSEVQSVCAERTLARCSREVGELQNKRPSALNTGEHTTPPTIKSKPDVYDEEGSDDDHEDSIDNDYNESVDSEDDDDSLGVPTQLTDEFPSTSYTKKPEDTENTGYLHPEHPDELVDRLKYLIEQQRGVDYLNMKETPLSRAEDCRGRPRRAEDYCAGPSRSATNDEADRSRYLNTTNLRVPTLDCFSANTASKMVWMGFESEKECFAYHCSCTAHLVENDGTEIYNGLLVFSNACCSVARCTGAPRGGQIMVGRLEIPPEVLTTKDHLDLKAKGTDALRGERLHIDECGRRYWLLVSTCVSINTSNGRLAIEKYRLPEVFAFYFPHDAPIPFAFVVCNLSLKGCLEEARDVIAIDFFVDAITNSDVRRATLIPESVLGNLVFLSTYASGTLGVWSDRTLENPLPAQKLQAPTARREYDRELVKETGNGDRGTFELLKGGDTCPSSTEAPSKPELLDHEPPCSTHPVVCGNVHRRQDSWGPATTAQQSGGPVVWLRRGAGVCVFYREDGKTPGQLEVNRSVTEYLSMLNEILSRVMAGGSGVRRRDTIDQRWGEEEEEVVGDTHTCSARWTLEQDQVFQVPQGLQLVHGKLGTCDDPGPHPPPTTRPDCIVGLVEEYLSRRWIPSPHTAKNRFSIRRTSALPIAIHPLPDSYLIPERVFSEMTYCDGLGIDSRYIDACPSETYSNAFDIQTCSEATGAEKSYIDICSSETYSKAFDHFYSDAFEVQCYSDAFDVQSYRDTFDIQIYSEDFDVQSYSDTSDIEKSYINACGSMTYIDAFDVQNYGAVFDVQSYSDAFDVQTYSDAFDLQSYSDAFDIQSYSDTFDVQSYSDTFDGQSYSDAFDVQTYSDAFDTYSDAFDIQSYSNVFDAQTYSDAINVQGYNDAFDVQNYSDAFDIQSYSDASGVELGGSKFINSYQISKTGSSISKIGGNFSLQAKVKVCEDEGRGELAKVISKSTSPRECLGVAEFPMLWTKDMPSGMPGRGRQAALEIAENALWTGVVSKISENTFWAGGGGWREEGRDLCPCRGFADLGVGSIASVRVLGQELLFRTKRALGWWCWGRGRDCVVLERFLQDGSIAGWVDKAVVLLAENVLWGGGVWPWIETLFLYKDAVLYSAGGGGVAAGRTDVDTSSWSAPKQRAGVSLSGGPHKSAVTEQRLDASLFTLGSTRSVIGHAMIWKWASSSSYWLLLPVDDSPLAWLPASSHAAISTGEARSGGEGGEYGVSGGITRRTESSKASSSQEPVNVSTAARGIPALLNERKWRKKQYRPPQSGLLLCVAREATCGLLGPPPAATLLSVGGTHAFPIYLSTGCVTSTRHTPTRYQQRSNVQELTLAARTEFYNLPQERQDNFILSMPRHVRDFGCPRGHPQYRSLWRVTMKDKITMVFPNRHFYDTK